MTNIVLCGGSGTRLWPLSRKLLPKQFVKIFDNKSLFQMTLERNQNHAKKFLIVTNAEQYFLAQDQALAQGCTAIDIILEPVGRNTAPAIALACLDINPEEIVLVTPSDHLIKNAKDYEASVASAVEFAKENYLVTFGILPVLPETGYGYIHFNNNDVIAFKEKPDRKTAEEYIDRGDYYWNSGMFCFKAGVYLDELKKHAPEIYEASLYAFRQSQKDGERRIRLQDMEKIPSNSIDYAVMEKSSKVKVVPCNAGWSDVGSFDSLHEDMEKNENHNAGEKELININSSGNLVMAQGKMVALVDIENLHIIDTPDALLVCKMGSGQKVKNVVEVLNQKKLQISDTHVTIYRPWGSFTVLEEGPAYKIKSIIVNPGKRLSLQKHEHRNEHWVVVNGTATVTIDSEIKTLQPNESTYIPKNVLHRLENKGESSLVIIEVQAGDYLGEDDIIRVQDDFKR
ncbi:MAG: mannose-1-phosphate guanylyltransferase/mannose-6-phosphate isomerase [Spirochaetia bacterium]|nr:mannose-1-phosphate guanylyltransferase/mannose-6-phosphate isomerase [Spirochaetia bacterium]